MKLSIWFEQAGWKSRADNGDTLRTILEHSRVIHRVFVGRDLGDSLTIGTGLGIKPEQGRIDSGTLFMEATFLGPPKLAKRCLSVCLSAGAALSSNVDDSSYFRHGPLFVRRNPNATAFAQTLNP